MTIERGYESYLRLATMPHILCPGCGHGIVLKSALRAIDRLGLDRDKVAFVAGIGCSSRLVGYVDFCTLHTTHGRALTFATGLKLARPDLVVIVITGDGDGLAIGGNHLIHAARRDVDLTCILLNNGIYGMTGGQSAPTTAAGAFTTTTTAGMTERSFDACRLAAAAGATFVARGMSASPLVLDEIIARAIKVPGFSFVEVVSDCPEFYGRYNDDGIGPEMMQAQRSRLAHVAGPLGAKPFVPGLSSSVEGALPTGVLEDGSQ
jgi:2-oxoglutarate/2-oxoacid ferredoxin oxidoreductase subunit beta